MFSCIHFLSDRKHRVISKRIQESTLKDGSAVAKPRPTNLVSKNLLSVKKDSSQELSDQTSAVNQELDQSGVLVRSWKLLRGTNQNPTMNCQERQQGDAQSFSTWKQGRRDEYSNSARTRKLSARREDNQFGKSKFHIHNMQISDYRYLENVFKNLRKRLNLAQDAPLTGIQALKTKRIDLGLYVDNNERSHSHGTKLQ